MACDFGQSMDWRNAAVLLAGMADPAAHDHWRSGGLFHGQGIPLLRSRVFVRCDRFSDWRFLRITSTTLRIDLLGSVAPLCLAMSLTSRARIPFTLVWWTCIVGRDEPVGWFSGNGHRDSCSVRILLHCPRLHRNGENSFVSFLCCRLAACRGNRRYSVDSHASTLKPQRRITSI